MSTREPAIQVHVDLCNPGQFFACCGLLELADRLFDGATGWFARDSFNVECSGSLLDVLQALLAHEPFAATSLGDGLAVKPLIAPLLVSVDGRTHFALTLDAWVTLRADKGEVVAVANPPWNFWSGQQTSFRIWRDLRIALVEQLPRIDADRLPHIFFERVLLSGRFGFDPGAAWSALDVGFSPNEQGIEVQSSAAVELLAAVGIQRFRPAMAHDRQSFIYASWGLPLPPQVASAAAADAISVSPCRRFRGRVISRGSYAALGHSTPFQGASDE